LRRVVHALRLGDEARAPRRWQPCRRYRWLVDQGTTGAFDLPLRALGLAGTTARLRPRRRVLLVEHGEVAEPRGMGDGATHPRKGRRELHLVALADRKPEGR